MKRRSAQAAFALATVAAATLAAWQGLQLQRQLRLNEAVAAAARPDAAVARDAPRELRLAHAAALARAGAFDAAFKAYSGLVEPGGGDRISRHAQYNLGNLVLRQGLATGARSEAGPLLELAKQRYRDLLRADPQDWDARYNLERALRAAPEEEDAAPDEDNEPVERRAVSLRGMKPGDLP
ncbi:MxaK protein [Rubrivivax gelatinosus]|nr:MxaK protein [Rubrivivax gelatinosus]